MINNSIIFISGRLGRQMRSARRGRTRTLSIENNNKNNNSNDNNNINNNNNVTSPDNRADRWLPWACSVAKVSSRSPEKPRENSRQFAAAQRAQGDAQPRTLGSSILRPVIVLVSRIPPANPTPCHRFFFTEIPIK